MPCVTKYCLSDGRKSWVLEASSFYLFISNSVFATRQEEKGTESWLTMSTQGTCTPKNHLQRRISLFLMSKRT